MNQPPTTPGLPQYPRPSTYADREQAKPLLKMISRMLSPKVKSTGIVPSQRIKIKHKKVKFY